MLKDMRGQWLSLLGLAVFILVPSFDTVGKYFGVVGIALYFVLGLAAVVVGYAFVWPHFRHRVSEKAAIVLASLLLVWLVIEVAIGYPLANSGRFGPGSDVDDALIIGAGQLLQGQYPYYVKTYLGLLPSPLPGAMLLAVPWVMAGAIQYQNVFWLGILFFLLRREFRSSVPTVALFYGLLLLSPTVHQSLVTGSDYISNTIYVLCAAWLVVKTGGDEHRTTSRSILSAAFFGLALSSRSNFLLVFPVLFVTLARKSGIKRAAFLSAVAVASFAIVTIPFWAFDPARFAPITTQGARIQLLEKVLPYSGILIPFFAALIGIAFAFRKNAVHFNMFLVINGAVQLFLVVATSLIYAIQTQRLNLFMDNSGYGLFGLFFGALGCWIFLINTRPGDFETDRAR